ncbi:MAG: 30S ribosomal protein S14 [Myxococcales bacterium]|nr:30S ribosomal protein S14 [Myxococcales bacterium]
MAKTSKIIKNEKRKKLVAKYAARRAELIKVMKDANASMDDKIEAQKALAKMPRDASATRIRNRCALTGRPRAYYRKFGLSRIALREEALAGNLPGVVKASW